MRKMLRILCMVMILAMVISISACQKSDNAGGTTKSTGDQKSTTTGDTEVKDPFAEHMELSFMGGSTNDPEIMKNNKLVQLTLEEKFNVSLSFSPCPYYNSPNEFNLTVAAGALPDFGFTCLTVKAPELHDKGEIRTIPKSDVQRLMPEYARKMESRPLMLAWQSKNDDEYYGFYQVSTIGMGGGFSTAVRLDWMENLGIKPKGNVQRLVPEGQKVNEHAEDKDIKADERLFVTDYQYSWDEFVELLDAFVHSDPDQNGQNDTYGLSTCILEFMDGYYGFHIFPVDGMYFRWVKEADGSTAPQRYSKTYKKFLEMHKELDDKGLMIPEYWSAIYSDVWQYWATGKAGAVGMVTSYLGGPSTPPYSILYENPDAKALMLPPTQGRRGLDSSFMGGSDIGYVFVNANVSDDEYERILRMVDWMYFTDEGKDFCDYGVEGTHYTRDEKGKIVPISAEENEKLAPEKRVSPGAYAVKNNHYWEGEHNLDTRTGLMFKYEKENWPAFEGYYAFYGPGSMGKIAATPFESFENKETKDNAYKEYVLDLLTGKTDSNTAYEKMMSVMNGLGYQDYLKVVNTSMYLTDELLKGKMVHPADIVK